MDIKNIMNTGSSNYKNEINNLINHYEKISELKEKRKEIKN